MIPRIEQKLEFSKSQYLFFLKWLKFKKGAILYPERRICSRYFDNKDFQMYNDTLEGIVPRKKIRIRTYDTEVFENSNSNYALEVKVTTEHKRLKSINKNIDFEDLIIDGIFDKNYGVCHQKVDISYLREYFLIDNIRVTIDRDIKYKLNDRILCKAKKELEDKSYVLEVKTDINKSLTFLSNNFDFPRSRFSKYERAIESLY